jgi:serine/threonine-protein kinase RsbW
MPDTNPMTNASDVRCFQARMEVLPQLLACMREACRHTGVAPPCILRVELAVEELFTNTVCHGYGGDCERPIWIETVQTADGPCVIYQDAAAPFDPLTHPDTPQNCRERPGGQGIALIRSLASRIAYVRSGDRNVLSLTFSASAA